jgi:hypothetical protein
MRTSQVTLAKWADEKQGCPYLDGAKIETRRLSTAYNRTIAYYTKRSLDRVKQACAQRVKVPSYPGLAHVGDAAKQLQVSTRTLRRLLKRHGFEAEDKTAMSVDGRPLKRSYVPEEFVAKVKADRAGRSDRMSIDQAAEFLGLTYEGVYNLIHRGVLLNFSGGPRKNGVYLSRKAVEAVKVKRDEQEAAAAAIPEGWENAKQLAKRFGVVLRAMQGFLREQRRSGLVPYAVLRWNKGALRRRYRQRFYEVAAVARRMPPRGMSDSGIEATRETEVMPSAGRKEAMEEALSVSAVASGGANEKTIGRATRPRVEDGEPYWNEIVETRKGVEEIRRALPNLPERTAEAVCERLPQQIVSSPESATPPSLIDRLQIDLVSCIAKLDGHTFSDVNADGLKALDALRKAQLEGKTPISKQKLREQYLSECNHNNTLTRWFRTLPGKLTALIGGQSGAGLRLILPPV